MKRKFIIYGLVLLVIPVTMLIQRQGAGGRRAEQETRGKIVIGPDGTIAVPRNDNMTIVSHLPRASTNAPPTDRK